MDIKGATEIKQVSYKSWSAVLGTFLAYYIKTFHFIRFILKVVCFKIKICTKEVNFTFAYIKT